MKMSEEEKEEMTDWLIAREECVEEDKKDGTDLTVVYLKGYADAEEKYRARIRELINERQFELQQEYKDFKDDIRLNTLQEIYYLGDEINDKRKSNRNSKRFFENGF